MAAEKGFHSLFGPGGISLLAPYLLHLNALHFSPGTI